MDEAEEVEEVEEHAALLSGEAQDEGAGTQVQEDFSDNLEAFCETSDEGDVVSMLEALSAEVAKLAGVPARLEEMEEQFKARIARSDYEDVMLKQYSDEIQEHRNDLYRKITLPLLKEMIGLRDMMASSVACAYEQNPETPVIEAKHVEMYRDMLEDALGDFGVEIHTPKLGDMLAVGIEKAVGKVKTVAKDAHGSLAAIASDGYLLEGKCISPAKVKVYVYEEQAKEEVGRVEGGQTLLGEVGAEKEGLPMEQSQEAADDEASAVCEPEPIPAYDANAC